MAEQDQPPLSAFPTPPSYFNSFTTTNLEHLSKLRREARLEREPEPASELAKILDLPSDLEHLVPPELPAEGQGWFVFGEERTLPPPDLPYLDPATPLLHPLPSSPESIIRLTRAALLAFLEISHILARDPTPDRRFGTKWEDLRDLLLNAHRAVNLYRPWAARQQLIRTLESYAADARREMAAIEELEGRVDSLLADLSLNREVVASGLEGVDGINGVHGVNGGIDGDGDGDGDGSGKGGDGGGVNGHDRIEDEKATWELIAECAS